MVKAAVAQAVERLRLAAEQANADPGVIARREAQAVIDQHNATRNRLLRGEVPQRLRELVMNGVRETDAVKAVGEWLQQPRTFLFLSGGVGTGKSVAAAFAIGMESGLWRKAVDVARLGQYEREEHARLEHARVLVLDDLGAEPTDASGWGAATILALLDKRYEASARTLVTTNLTGSQLVSRYGSDGGRLVDRMREAGTWVTLSGESMRRAQP